MNNHAKTSPLIVVGAIALIAILGFLAYAQYSQTQLQGGTDEGGVIIPSAGCAQNPTIVVGAVDKIATGSAVTVTTPAIVNGQWYSTIPTALNKGDKVSLLVVNATNYIDAIIPEFTVDCGINLINAKIAAAATAPTVTIMTDAGTAALTDAAAGGATNETAFSAGGAKNWELTISGTDKKSTGNLIMVVELGVEGNVSSATLSNADTGAVLEKLSTVPQGLTVSGTNNYRVAFRIPSVDGAVKKTYNLNVQAASAKVISGAVYTTYYVEQSFTQPTGTFATGVSDSEGTAKYETSYDYDFFITA